MTADLDVLDAPVAQADLLEPVARIYGQPMEQLPLDLYIPPDALAIMLDAFEGPLDLLLYMIRRANIDILDIPMAPLTRQYLDYVEAMRAQNLELAADYLVMAAMLIEIKSRMLLPRPKLAEGEEAEDPRAELVRRLMEYEQMKLAGQKLNEMPQAEREFFWVETLVEKSLLVRLPEVSVDDLGSLDGRRAPGRAEEAPQDRPRGTVRARAHGHHPAHPAGEGWLCAVRNPVRHRHGAAGLGRAFFGHARTGAGKDDPYHANRSLCADLHQSEYGRTGSGLGGGRWSRAWSRRCLRQRCSRHASR